MKLLLVIRVLISERVQVGSSMVRMGRTWPSKMLLEESSHGLSATLRVGRTIFCLTRTRTLPENLPVT